MGLYRLFHAQKGVCWYCDRPTWLRASGETKLAAMIRLGIEPGAYRCKADLRARAATIEHLKRRADGGTMRDGVVMACASCNSRRGAVPPSEHQQAMRQTYQVLS
jgi:hypothetical protein